MFSISKNFLYNIRCSCKNFKSFKRKFSVDFVACPELVEFCAETFELPTHRVKSLMLEFPTLQHVETKQVEGVLSALSVLGVSKAEILKRPRVLNIHPRTIENRWKILTECGITNINLKVFSKYISIVNKYSISELRMGSLLSQDGDVWLDLVKCFHLWPDIQNQLIHERCNINTDTTLCALRIDILKKFLHHNFKLPAKTFDYFMVTYKLIKHRPLSTISQTVHIHKFDLNLTDEKFLAYGLLYQLDPGNIINIIKEVKELGGLDIKEVLYKYPVIMKNPYQSLLQIKQIFKDEGITNEEQKRCFLLYTYSPKTVLERIKQMKTIDNFKGFQDHPRITTLLYNRSKVLDRLKVLQNLNKKCVSLHKLTAGQKEFDRFTKSFGDKTKGVDLLIALGKLFESKFPLSDLRHQILKHQYWTHVPLVSTINVIEYLQPNFTLDDMFNNCQVFLYPLEDVKKYTELLLSARDSGLLDGATNSFISILFPLRDIHLSGINYANLTNAQVLSLVLYMLERDHHFSDSGVWPKQTSVTAIAVRD